MATWKLCECKTWCTWFEMLRYKNYNWIMLDLCTLQLEYDTFGPLFKFQVGLLGFNFYISFNLPWETKQSSMIQDRYNKSVNSKYFYKFVKVKNKNYKSKRNRKPNKTNSTLILDNTMFG